MTQPAQLLLQQEGKKIKFSELLLDTFDKFGFKGAEKYFDNAEQEVLNEQTAGVEQAGAGIGGAGGSLGGNEIAQGMAGGAEMAGEPGIPQLG